MIDNIKVRYVDWMPSSTSELVARCCEDGQEYYTIMLNASHTQERLSDAYIHAMEHINNADFDKVCDVDVLESIRHEKN